MKAIKINFYLDRPSSEKSSILARYSYNGKPYKYYPKISVSTSSWNKSKMRVDHRKEMAWDINDQINKVEKAIKNVLVSYQKNSIDPPATKQINFAIQSEIKRLDEVDPEINVTEFVNDFYRPWIVRKSEKKKEYFKRRWDTTVDDAIEAWPNLKFEDINDDFFHDFVSFLIDDRDNINNTINGKVKRMQQLCREAMKWGYKVHPHFNDFKFPGERIPPIYLKWSEVEAIEKLEGLDKRQSYVRDRFLFRCYTGIRISDMKYMHKSMVSFNSGMRILNFEKVKQASRHSIFLSDKAYHLWDRNNFDFTSGKYSTQQWESFYIKEVLKIAEVDREVQVMRHQGSDVKIEYKKLYEVVSSHTARRTYARAWYDRGGDMNMLRENLGHMDLATTLRYVGVEKDETNREAARLFG